MTTINTSEKKNFTDFYSVFRGLGVLFGLSWCYFGTPLPPRSVISPSVRYETQLKFLGLCVIDEQ